MHPRMQLLMRGRIISIQFGDTVVICAPGRLTLPLTLGFFPDILADTEYTDRLELKSASDRTLGVGVIFTDDATLMVLTAATLMKVVIDAEKVVKFQAA